LSTEDRNIPKADLILLASSPRVHMTGRTLLALLRVRYVDSATSASGPRTL